MLCTPYGFLVLVMLGYLLRMGVIFFCFSSGGVQKHRMFFGGRKACGSKQGTEMAEQKHLSLSFFPDSNFVCFALLSFPFALEARRPQARYLFPCLLLLILCDRPAFTCQFSIAV
jgi:hypothetical protein